MQRIFLALSLTIGLVGSVGGMAMGLVLQRIIDGFRAAYPNWVEAAGAGGGADFDADVAREIR